MIPTSSCATASSNEREQLDQPQKTAETAKKEAMKEIKGLCDQVRQTAYDIHVFHGHGHLEKVYENALAHRLRKLGLDVTQQHPLTVYDEDGTIIGEYLADLFIDGALIIELKACRTLAAEHTAQILGYLKAARREHRLLINFGSFKFEIRKYALSESSRSSGASPFAAVFFAISAVFCG
jgi:GxxExxY protein